MSTYLVFARPGASAPDENSAIIADRFSTLAFVFPVFWLLFNRLWLEALVAALVLGAAVMMMAGGPLFWIGLVTASAVSLLTGLEGRNWRASALARRGWRFTDLVEASNAETAFEIHAARALKETAITAEKQSAQRRFTSGMGRHNDGDSGAIGLVPVERT